MSTTSVFSVMLLKMSELKVRSNFLHTTLCMLCVTSYNKIKHLIQAFPVTFPFIAAHRIFVDQKIYALTTVILIIFLFEKIDIT